MQSVFSIEEYRDSLWNVHFAVHTCDGMIRLEAVCHSYIILLMCESEDGPTCVLLPYLKEIHVFFSC